MRNQVEINNNPSTNSYRDGNITPMEDSLEKESMLSPLKQGKFVHNENASGPSQLTSIRNHSEEERQRKKKKIDDNIDEIGNQELAVSVGDTSKNEIEYATNDLMRKTLNIDKNKGMITPH